MTLLCPFDLPTLLSKRLDFLFGFDAIAPHEQSALDSVFLAALGQTDHSSLRAFCQLNQLSTARAHENQETTVHWNITFDRQLPFSWWNQELLSAVQTLQKKYHYPLDTHAHDQHCPPRQSIGCFLMLENKLPMGPHNQSVLATLRGPRQFKAGLYNEACGGIKEFVGCALLNELNEEWQLLHYHQGQWYQILLIDPMLLPQFNRAFFFASQTLINHLCTPNDYRLADKPQLIQALKDLQLFTLANIVQTSTLPTLICSPKWFDAPTLHQRLGLRAQQIDYQFQQDPQGAPFTLMRMTGWGYLDQLANAFEWRLIGQVPDYLNLINPRLDNPNDEHFLNAYAQISAQDPNHPDTGPRLLDFFTRLTGSNTHPESCSFFINRENPTLPVIGLPMHCNGAIAHRPLEQFLKTCQTTNDNHIN